MLDGCTPLHIFSAVIVTAYRYRNEILEPYVQVFQRAIEDQFFFMDDNTRHIQLYLLTIILKKKVFTAWSQELNSIEQVDTWKILLEEAMLVDNPPPSLKFLQALKKALLDD